MYVETLTRHDNLDMLKIRANAGCVAERLETPLKWFHLLAYYEMSKLRHVDEIVGDIRSLSTSGALDHGVKGHGDTTNFAETSVDET